MDSVAIPERLSDDVAGGRDVLSTQILDNLRRYVGVDDDDLETHFDNVVDRAQRYVVRRDPHTP
ncbi:hypothetical protein [Gordonia oryzae]|uniref:hypothetical protein n=1 Tax=Gordonia oryzae TaxID=2487349 RepID=UPI001FE8002D|nr:hypothetical protein [Gordonia oryzae]